jgi:hypothetical protein
MIAGAVSELWRLNLAVLLRVERVEAVIDPLRSVLHWLQARTGAA